MPARAEIPVVALGPKGTPAGGASVRINLLAGTPATVYAARSGVTTLANPLTADAYGNVAGYVERGTYVAVIAYLAFPPYSVEFDAAPAADGSIDGLWLPDGVVTGPKVASAIKDASAATPALRSLGTGATQAAAGNIMSTYQPRQFRLKRTVVQPIANGTVTAVAWDAEEYDLPGNNQHDNVTNNSRFTCVEAGLYEFILATVWASSNTGVRYIDLLKNGTTDLGAFRNSAVETSEGVLPVQTRLVVGDYVEARVYQASGVSLNLGFANGTPELNRLNFSGYRAGA